MGLVSHFVGAIVFWVFCSVWKIKKRFLQIYLSLAEKTRWKNELFVFLCKTLQHIVKRWDWISHKAHEQIEFPLYKYSQFIGDVCVLFNTAHYVFLLNLSYFDVDPILSSITKLIIQIHSDSRVSLLGYITTSISKLFKPHARVLTESL